jgi:hypothetical protein
MASDHYDIPAVFSEPHEFIVRSALAQDFELLLSCPLSLATPYAAATVSGWNSTGVRSDILGSPHVADAKMAGLITCDK